MPIKTHGERKKHLAQLGTAFDTEVTLLKKALTAISKNKPVLIKHKSLRAERVIMDCVDTLRGLIVSVRTHLLYLAEPVKKPTAAKLLRPAKTGKVSRSAAVKSVKNVAKKKTRKK